jgi:hypothetical protein
MIVIIRLDLFTTMKKKLYCDHGVIRIVLRKIMDYTCERGRYFLVSTNCVTISNPGGLSSSEKRG